MGERVVIDDCAFVTMDGAGAEFRRGHVVIDGTRIAGVSEEHHSPTQATADAGFGAVELWWPWPTEPVPTDADVDAFVRAVRDAGVQLVGLNFFAGELTGPTDAGALSIPCRSQPRRPTRRPRGPLSCWRLPSARSSSPVAASSTPTPKACSSSSPS